MLGSEAREGILAQHPGPSLSPPATLVSSHRALSLVSHRPSSSARSASTHPREAARAEGQAPPLGCCPGDGQLHHGLLSVGSSGSPVLPGRCLPLLLVRPSASFRISYLVTSFVSQLPAFLRTETDLPWVPPVGGMPCTEDCLEDCQCLRVALGTMLDMKTGFHWALGLLPLWTAHLQPSPAGAWTGPAEPFGPHLLSPPPSALPGVGSPASWGGVGAAWPPAWVSPL